MSETMHHEAQFTVGADGRCLTFLSQKQQFQAKAYVLGDQIDLTSMGLKSRAQSVPLFISFPSGGMAVLYRFGAVVFFDASADTVQHFLFYAAQFVAKHQLGPEKEGLTIQVSSSYQGFKKGEVLCINEVTPIHLELIADVMAKSVMLDKHEVLITERFDQVKSIARNVIGGNIRYRDKELLRYIGLNLLTEYELAGRVETTEKPSILWDRSDFDAFHNEVAEEFELTERQTVIDRKLEVISRTAQIYLDVSQHQHGLRLEWYIIVLISIEIVLDLYSIFYRVHG